MSGPELRIDLAAFARNLDAVRARIAPAQLLLVVKDDAYGHGLERMVRAARTAGVAWFGSFGVTEALRARAVAGPEARVFSWLSVGAAQIVEALGADIELGVGDAPFLEDVAAVARTEGTPARVHLKIDTGLHRNGIRPEDWSAVVARAVELQEQGHLRVVGVWSHLAEASDEEDDAARGVFEEAVETATAAGLSIEVRHLSASAASFARPEFRYDLVRIGAFCYGIRSAGGESLDGFGIVPVASLVAPVTSVGDHELTIGIGSLHGLPSTLGLRGRLSIGAQRTGIREVRETRSTLDRPARMMEIPADVTVFGAGAASATDLGESIGTVGEEILLRISPLVPRVER